MGNVAEPLPPAPDRRSLTSNPIRRTRPPPPKTWIAFSVGGTGRINEALQGNGQMQAAKEVPPLRGVQPVADEEHLMRTGAPSRQSFPPFHIQTTKSLFALYTLHATGRESAGCNGPGMRLLSQPHWPRQRLDAPLPLVICEPPEHQNAYKTFCSFYSTNICSALPLADLNRALEAANAQCGVNGLIPQKAEETLRNAVTN